MSDEHEFCDINAEMIHIIRDITVEAGTGGIPFLDDAVRKIVVERDRLRADLAAAYEKLKRQQEHHVRAMREQDETAQKVYEEVVADLDAARAAHAELWVERNALLRGLAAERAARAEAEAACAAIMIALTLLWEWGATVAFPSEIGRRYLIVAESAIKSPNPGRALLEAFDAAVEALRGQLIEPSQIYDHVAVGGCWEEKPLDEWVCNHCGNHGDTATTIEHADDCTYVSSRAALAKAAAVNEAWRKATDGEGGGDGE